MSDCRTLVVVRSAALGLLTASWMCPAVAQTVMTPEAQMATPAQEYAVIGRETIPIPLLSVGGQASVAQSGQANVLTLDQQGRASAMAQQIGSSNMASATMRGDQSILSLIQAGNANKATVAVGAGNTVGVQQNGDNNRTDITLNVRGAAITSEQNGSNLSNAITQSGVGKAVTVIQSR